RLGIERPGPDVRMQSAIGIEVLATKHATAVGRAPTGASEVAVSQVFGQVEVVPAWGDCGEAKARVGVDPWNRDVVNLIPKAATELLLECGRWWRKRRNRQAVVPVGPKW